MQISGKVDKVESDRQYKALHNKEVAKSQRIRREAKEASNEASLKDRAGSFFVMEGESMDDTVAINTGDGDVINTPSELLEKRNVLDIAQTAQTAIRYETGSREAAAIVTSFFGDMIR